MEFSESGWVFRFTNDWIVKKFDDHRYYRWLSGKGFKAVDFIAFQPNVRMLCIEVKNYRRESPEAQEVADLFCKKVSDTLQVVDIIERYFLRKPFYRLLRKIIQRWPQFFGEWGFWTEIADIMPDKERCFFVLWLKTRDEDEHFSQRIKALIKAQLDKEYRFFVMPYDQAGVDLGVEAYSEN